MTPGVHQVQNILKAYKFLLPSEIQTVLCGNTVTYPQGEIKDILDTDIYKIVLQQFFFRVGKVTAGPEEYKFGRWVRVQGSVML